MFPWPGIDKEFSLIGQTSQTEHVKQGSQPTFFQYLYDLLQRKEVSTTQSKGWRLLRKEEKIFEEGDELEKVGRHGKNREKSESMHTCVYDVFMH